MAWRDPRVRALSQFLLYDSPPDTRFPPGSQRYWSTFQTGLRYQNGVGKPSLGSYRLPLFIPDPVTSKGSPTLVWAMLRTAPHGSSERAQVQWKPTAGGAFRTLATVGTHNPNGVLAEMVQLPGTGVVRIAWSSPSGQLVYSRRVGVRSR
jgi:hypothetical protein